MAKIKCGLEIHQQLDTHKLFCECPSIIEEELKGEEFHRFLHLSTSEMGEIDKAVLHEAEKNNYFHYIATRHTCLVEMDEEPPHEINKEALITALQFTEMVNAKRVEETHVMRKIVIDGSNTTGFQRTMLIGMNGYIEVEGKRIGIETICLEEDAARRVDNKFVLDRLGIPLIEIATAPDISNGKEARKVAEYLGLLLRSLKVKRGLGTIRQDVNISIEGGERIEIKGVQDLRIMDKIIELEAQRQERLLQYKEKVKKIDVSSIIDVSKYFKNSNSKLFKGKETYMIILKDFKDLLGYELYKGKRIATEISDYLKTKLPIKGLIHRDELPGYGLTIEELEKIEKGLGIGKKDNYVFFITSKEIALKARQLFIERLTQLSKGVPREVRKANMDGTTTFLRPMPGKERMYPETDIPPMILKGIKVEKPKTIFEIIKEYEEKGLPRELAVIAAKEKIPIIELAEKHGLTPKEVARITIQLGRQYGVKLKEKEIDILLELYKKKEITMRGIEKLMTEYKEKNIFSPEKYKALTRKEIEHYIKELLTKTTNMKEIMRKISEDGRIDPKIAIEIVKKELSK